jgi:hypothetical protein
VHGACVTLVTQGNKVLVWQGASHLLDEGHAQQFVEKIYTVTGLFTDLCLSQFCFQKLQNGDKTSFSCFFFFSTFHCVYVFQYREEPNFRLILFKELPRAQIAPVFLASHLFCRD